MTEGWGSSLRTNNHEEYDEKPTPAESERYVKGGKAYWATPKTPAELPDCEGCIDSREGTHGYGTKQHGLAPAESSEVPSRSQQKRIAAMKGERPPTFGVEPSVPAFTPGPWELDSAKDGDSRYQIIHGQIPKGLNGDFGYPVADTMNRHHGIFPEEDRANAQLISAAPDMYEALQLVIEWERDYRTRNNLGKDAPSPFMLARAALQKASGK